MLIVVALDLVFRYTVSGIQLGECNKYRVLPGTKTALTQTAYVLKVQKRRTGFEPAFAFSPQAITAGFVATCAITVKLRLLETTTAC